MKRKYSFTEFNKKKEKKENFFPFCAITILLHISIHTKLKNRKMEINREQVREGEIERFRDLKPYTVYIASSHK
jgi:hypothetical protein